MSARRLSLPAAFLIAVGLGACSDGGSLQGPLSPDAEALVSSGPVLIECPVSTSKATSGVLDPLGGSITLDGNELHLPLLAVRVPTEFRLEVPASRFVELDIQANGQDSFEFEKSVRITIDYSRCSRSNIDGAALTVWQIDPETKELIEHMGGVDDKVSRTVTFETDHLSTYSIAR